MAELFDPEDRAPVRVLVICADALRGAPIVAHIERLECSARAVTPDELSEQDLNLWEAFVVDTGANLDEVRRVVDRIWDAHLESTAHPHISLLLPATRRWSDDELAFGSVDGDWRVGPRASDVRAVTERVRREALHHRACLSWTRHRLAPFLLERVVPHLAGGGWYFHDGSDFIKQSGDLVLGVRIAADIAGDRECFWPWVYIRSLCCPRGPGPPQYMHRLLGSQRSALDIPHRDPKRAGFVTRLRDALVPRPISLSNSLATPASRALAAESIIEIINTWAKPLFSVIDRESAAWWFLRCYGRSWGSRYGEEPPWTTWRPASLDVDGCLAARAGDIEAAHELLSRSARFLEASPRERRFWNSERSAAISRTRELLDRPAELDEHLTAIAASERRRLGLDQARPLAEVLAERQASNHGEGAS